MEKIDIPLSYKKGYFTKSKVIICMLIILSFSAQKTFGSTNITVRPYEIKFDYDDTSHDNDALTILDADGEEATTPEWNYSPSRSNNIAYIKSQSNRRIKVKFDSNCSDMHLIINLTVTSGTGLGEICNYFVCNYEDLDEITLTLDGSIPNIVDVRTFTWEWEIYAISNEAGYCSATSTNYTTHTYYTLLSTPQAPMAEPWSSVLDYACDWANGQSSSSGTAEEIVKGLYSDTDFMYDVQSGSPRYTSYGNQSFNLTTMLSEIGGSEIIVNCYDMGKAVKIFANALGCDSDYAYTNPFGYLNCIKAIGRGWSNNPFYESNGTDAIVGEDDDYNDGRTRFGNHAFCILSSTIYDACLKVDTDSNPDAAPHSESWAYGWSWTNYKSKVIDNNPVSNPGTPYTSYNDFIVY